MLNIRVFAPMPNDRDTTATAVKPGVLSSNRTAYRIVMEEVYQAQHRRSCACPPEIGPHTTGGSGLLEPPEILLHAHSLLVFVRGHIRQYHPISGLKAAA